MMDEDEASRTLVEEREGQMVAYLGSREPVNRKGWFLKPTSKSSKPWVFAPFAASFYNKNSRSPKISFKGWVCSFRQWDQWVQKLRAIYSELWRKVGIFDAINVTTYKFRRDPSSLCGVARFWCEETNTFIFPWAEATVTLEDVMILLGFSVLGEPVRVNGQLDGELAELESEMVREVKMFNKSKCKKADFSAWLKHFMEKGNGEELEHIAFLMLWLSRFVLPSHPPRTVGQHVIHIAVRLARGVRIALAPAVLASLYRDLRNMKTFLADPRSHDASTLDLWAPFNVLQLWVWERFLALRPDPADSIGPDEPRAARWHLLGKKLDYSFVKSVIKSPDEIQWRPYAASVPYYRDIGGWVCYNESMDEGIKSFAVCLRACKLVGLDCIEHYLPHRVARQFGLDQDVPDCFSHADSTWEVAWQSYDISAGNIKFYVPPRLFESDVTLRYSIWWENVRKLLKKRRKGKKRKKALSMICCKKKKVEDTDDTTLLDWLTQNETTLSAWLTRKDEKQRSSSLRRSKKITELSTDSAATQEQIACTKTRSLSRCKKFTETSTASAAPQKQYACESSSDIKLNLVPPEIREEDADTLYNIQIRDETGTSYPLHVEAIGVEEEISGTNTSLDLKTTIGSSMTMKQDPDANELSSIQVRKMDTFDEVQEDISKVNSYLDFETTIGSSGTMEQDANVDELSDIQVRNEMDTSAPLGIEVEGVQEEISGTNTSLDLETTIESSGMMEQDADADADELSDIQVRNEMDTSNPLDIEVKGVQENISETNKSLDFETSIEPSGTIKEGANANELSNIQVRNDMDISDPLDIEVEGVQEDISRTKTSLDFETTTESSSGIMKQDADADELSNIQVRTEMDTSDPLDIEVEGFQEDISKTNSSLDFETTVESSGRMQQDADEDELRDMQVKNRTDTSDPLDIEDKKFQEDINTTNSSLDLETTLESSKTVKQDAYADELDDILATTVIDTSDPSDIEDKGDIENISREEVGDFVCEPEVIDIIEENSKMEDVEEISIVKDKQSGLEMEIDRLDRIEENLNMEDVEEMSMVRDKQSGLEMEIDKLKKEIALIHARVRDLENMAEVKP